MGLTNARIAEVKADLFAEDIDVPAEAVGWSEERLVAYIERGGVEPTSVPAGTVPPVPLGRPTRVACLHGTAGNEKIFRIQLAKLIASLREEIVFEVFEGSRVIEPGNPHGDSMRKYFGQKEVLREYAPALIDADGLRIYEPQATADAVLTWSRAYPALAAATRCSVSRRELISSPCSPRATRPESARSRRCDA